MKQPDANSSSNSNSVLSDLNKVNNMPQQIRSSRAGGGNYRRLIEACKRKDLEMIKSILSEQPDLANQRDKQNRTLLHYAVILLLDGDDNDDDENEPQIEFKQQIMMSKGEILHCIECFDYLTNRCDIKLWWQQDSDGLSVLHMAVISSNVPMVEHIIYEHPYAIKYPLVSIRDHEHHSPLHWAVITNNLDSVKLLINYAGTKLAHEPDLNGATPLHYATQTSDYPRYRQQLLSMLKSVGAGSSMSKRKQPTDGKPACKVQIKQSQTNRILDTNANVDEQKLIGDTNSKQQQQQRQQKLGKLPVESSTTSQTVKSFEILEYLVKLPQINLECADKDQRTPLLWAASSGNCDAVELLLVHGANAHSCDANRLGALHCAASHGYTDCLECLLTCSRWTTKATTTTTTANSNNVNNKTANSCNRILVDANQVDNLNCTPLFYSVLSGNVDCVETLLEHGAHSDWQDSKGRTAAHFAALKGQLGALKLLQERGANLWLANKQGDLPLHYAIKSGRLQVVRWLLEHSPYERAVNAINNFGRAPIHLAIMRDNVQLVEYLIRCGANLNQLVKMRTKPNSNSRSATKTSNQGSLEMQTEPTVAASGAARGSLEDSKPINVGSGKNPTVYHYETAVDMAKRLGFSDCLQLLEQNQAKPASQVISSRQQQQQQQRGSLGDSGGRSLFDIQSVEGPSPIGFETSCSSASPNTASLSTTNMATSITTSTSNRTGTTNTESQAKDRAAPPTSGGTKVPKLRRPPPPDSLPCTDSTASSALSQNSLTSVRGGATGELPDVNVRDSTGQNQDSCDDEAGAKKDEMKDSHRTGGGGGVGSSSGNRKCTGGAGGFSRPYQGGISYNNEHICASIKCKLYDRADHQTGYGDCHSQPQGSRGPAYSAPAPTQRACWRGGQEIVTNVNVYTSPCAHCMLQKQAGNRKSCQDCFSSPNQPDELPAVMQLQSSQARGGYSKGETRHQQQQQMTTRNDDDETTDGPSGSEYEEDDEEDEIGQPRMESRLPSLAISSQPSGFNRLRYLPPSQGHEQHLPVIMSDREHSTASATSNEQQEEEDNDAEVEATMARGDDEQLAHQEGQVSGDFNSKDGYGNSNNKASNGKRQLVSPAFEEPRFDRSQEMIAVPSATNRMGRSHDRYMNQVKSPVAEYIRGGTATQHNKPEVPSSSSSGRMGKHSSGASSVQRQNRSSSTQRPLPDFSQVKPKVDSNRLPADLDIDPTLANHRHGNDDGDDDVDGDLRAASRSKSMSMLSHDSHSTRLAPTTTTTTPMHKSPQPMRSEMGSRSVSRQTIIKTRRLSVDSVELATRVEKAIRKYRFETKLFEELQNLKRSQIRSGRANEALLVKRLVEHLRQDTRDLIGLDTYQGPYTYKSYERFLYDQLRKLSQSNCAKLSRHQPPYSHLMMDDESTGDEHNYLDDDMKADMELRKIINGSHQDQDHDEQQNNDGGNGSDTESYVLEPSGALEEIRVKGESEGDLDNEERRRMRKKPTQVSSSQKETMQIIHTTTTSEDALDGEEEAPILKPDPLDNSEQQRQLERRMSLDGPEPEVDVDKEKFRTAKSDEESRIEEEAKSMSSAIIVDALGNVSRAGSLTDLTKVQLDDLPQLNTTSHLISPDRKGMSKLELDTADTKEQEVIEQLSDGGDAPTKQPKGRRRSIINIGNKMECIYHDVGIEIDPAPDVDFKSEWDESESHKEGDEMKELTQSDDDHHQHVIEKKIEEGLADVIEEQQQIVEEKWTETTKVDELVPDRKSEESPSMESDIDDETQETSEHSGTPTTIVDTHKSSISDSSSQHHRKATRPTSPDASTSSGATSRRASSPSTCRADHSSRGSRRVDPKHWSGSSSFGGDTKPSPGPTVAAGKAKVFNGHDLDALHRERSRSRGASSRRDQAVAEADEKKKMRSADDIDADSDHPPGKKKSSLKEANEDSSENTDSGKLIKIGGSEMIASMSQVEEEVEDVSNMVDQNGIEPEKTPRRPIIKRRTIKKRLARSRLRPGSKYKPRVPLEEVKQRWSRIKAEERLKMKQARIYHRGSSGRVEFLQTSGGYSNDNNNSSRLMATGGGGGALSVAKSQPNLKDEEVRLYQDGQLKASYTNQIAYTLLYEINEAMKGHYSGFGGSDSSKNSKRQNSKKGSSGKSAHQWCQRMAAQIVDVRTVKRTLSLPEAVIYSNDLLKRFNILKL